MINRAKATLAVALAVSVAACGQAPRSAAPTPAEVIAAFAGSPSPLARLHAEANQLRPTSPASFKALLAGLHGYPVIVNLWGAWCGACRAEFPIFQQAAVALGRHAAFIGLDVSDSPDDASTFLREFPVTYPSFQDPGAHVAFALRAGAFYPTTEFYSRAGALNYTHAGQYFSLAQLKSDVAAYGGA